ncbi:MAG: hypothetical protein ACI4F2_02865 [Acutalibacteraceae bacterium]
MKKNKINFIKRFSAIFFSAVILCSSAVAVSATTDRHEDKVNGNTVISTAYASRNKATISSMAGSDTGSVQGTHTITYRAQATSTSSMQVKSETKTFGGTGGMIIKDGLYLVDYSSGKHVYQFTGTGSLTVNSKAYY